MSEIYQIEIKNGTCEFVAGGNAPDWALAPKFDPAAAKGCKIVCRMGDPDLVHCAVFQMRDKPGGIFVVYDKTGLLFVTIASTNLAFAVAQGYFGAMTANARYGADVFENMEIPDD